MTDKQEQNISSAKIKEFLPIIWSSYEHMYEARETNTRNSINFLLVVVTFLPILCLSLYNRFPSTLFLIPALFQGAALLILLKSFFVKAQIPWLECEKTLRQLDDGSFADELFFTLKAVEGDTYDRLQALREVIRRALFLMIFSIFLIALAGLFIFLKGSFELYVATALLSLAFLLLHFFYKEVPKSDFDKRRERCKSVKQSLEEKKK